MVKKQNFITSKTKKHLKLFIKTKTKKLRQRETIRIYY